jgi:WD40 repeat protein
MFRSKSSKIIVTIFLTSLIIVLLIRGKTWRIPIYSRVIAFSPNGEMIATASGKIIERRITPENTMGDYRKESSQVEIRKVTTGKIIQTLDFFAASSLAFSADNSLIAAGGFGGQINVWRISDGQLVHSFKTEVNYVGYRTMFLSFTPDRKTLVASIGEIDFTNTNKLYPLSVWSLDNGKERYTLTKPYTCAAASPDGQLIAIGGYQQPLILYRLKDGTPIRQTEQSPGTCGELKFTADSQLLISRSSSDINVYNVKDGKLLRKIFIREPNEDKELPTDFAVSPDNRYLAVSYGAVFESSLFVFAPEYYKAFFGRIRFWDLKGRGWMTTIWGHWRGAGQIEFSPDGKWLVSVSRTNLRFWRMPPPNYFLWMFLVMLGLVAIGYWQRAWLKNLSNEQ